MLEFELPFVVGGCGGGESNRDLDPPRLVLWPIWLASPLIPKIKSGYGVFILHALHLRSENLKSKLWCPQFSQKTNAGIIFSKNKVLAKNVFYCLRLWPRWEAKLPHSISVWCEPSSFSHTIPFVFAKEGFRRMNQMRILPQTTSMHVY